jgi:hypothetical protein
VRRKLRRRLEWDRFHTALYAFYDISANHVSNGIFRIYHACDLFRIERRRSRSAVRSRDACYLHASDTGIAGSNAVTTTIPQKAAGFHTVPIGSICQARYFGSQGGRRMSTRDELRNNGPQCYGRDMVE